MPTEVKAVEPSLQEVEDEPANDFDPWAEKPNTEKASARDEDEGFGDWGEADEKSDQPVEAKPDTVSDKEDSFGEFPETSPPVEAKPVAVED